MDYKIRVNPNERMAYLPRALVDRFGSELTIFPDKVAAILYPTGQDPKRIIRSVQALLNLLEIDADIKPENEPKKNGENGVEAGKPD